MSYFYLLIVCKCFVWFQILYFSRKAKQSGVNLRLMPVGMSKRKENTSMFSRK